MSDIFVRVPDSLVQTLDKDLRTTLIDFWADENKNAIVRNNLGGQSELKELSDDYLFLQTSTGNSIEIKMLPINEYYNILCLVNTGCAPACDSGISFYTVDWKSLKNSYFPPITESAFFKSNPTDSCSDKIESLDMHPIKLALNKDNLKLTATYSIGQYLNKEDFENLKPCLQESISFDWIDGKYQSE
jgi:hypothetical protein